MTRTERTYYVVSGLYTLAQFFIAPIYPLFLLSRGLDLFRMNAVLATYLITVFVFEVPTGAITDRFGRKRSFLAACMVRMTAYALYAFARDFADCPLHIVWQPRLEALAGKGLWRMGWIVGLLNLTALVGNAILPRLLRRFARETVLAAAALWRGGTVAVAAAAVTAAPMVAGLVFQEIAFGLSDPVLLAWTNEHVAAAERATVLSVRSTFFTLGGASGLMILGLVARDLGIPTAWAVGAVLFALAAPLYLALGRLAPRVPSREAGVEATVVVPAKVAPPAVEPAYVGERGASS